MIWLLLVAVAALTTSAFLAGWLLGTGDVEGQCFVAATIARGAERAKCARAHAMRDREEATR